MTTDPGPVLEWFASEEAVDIVARALMNERHREINDELPDDSDCGGWTFDPPCGGCSACIYKQATFADHTEEGFAVWQAKAQRLLNHVGHQLAFKAGQEGK